MRSVLCVPRILSTDSAAPCTKVAFENARAPLSASPLSELAERTAGKARSVPAAPAVDVVGLLRDGGARVGKGMGEWDGLVASLARAFAIAR